MNLQFIGKFYDNHSLSIVNRNLVLGLYSKGYNISIIALDSYDPKFNVSKEQVAILKDLEKDTDEIPDIQIRHSYPPIWNWPDNPKTKVVFIQPWEFPKAPFEWQYKFENFADALIVPSNYVKNVFLKGGLNPENVFVGPNGYDPSVFNTLPGNSVERFNVNKDKFNFIFVGNSQWRKGLDLLLKLWPQAFSRSDNARLIIKDNSYIYGNSNILEEIIKLQYNNDCAEIIYIDEELTADEMADLYKSSKAVVHPYRAEGFGMHIQEAIACGCVPIISANGPTDDFIQKDKGLRIGITPTPINILDPNVFAAKPGDSMTLMSSHTFINEPSLEQLFRAMKFLYHSHDRETKIKELQDTSLLKTWSKVLLEYENILELVNSRDNIRRNK